MGGNFSYANQQIQSELKSKLDAHVCNASINNESNTGGNIIIENISDCVIEGGNINYNYDGQCVFNTTIEAIKKLALDNRSDAKSLFGISTSISEQDVRDRVEQLINADCGIISVNQKTGGPGDSFFVKGCNKSKVNIANIYGYSKTSCAVDLIAKAMGDTSGDNSSKANQDISINSVLFALIIGIVIIVIVVAFFL